MPTLYASRKLLNSDEFIEWAKDQGFEKVLQPGDLHVTVVYSKTLMDWPAPRTGGLVVSSREGRFVEPLGDDGAIVLKFESPPLSRRWQELRYRGAVTSYPTYTPHVTITWEAQGDLDLQKVEPYTGPLIFGPEVFEEVDEDWQDGVTEKIFNSGFYKVDDQLGIAFGWAIISKVDGDEYYDLQDDHIPEDAMLKASVDFMEYARIAGDMHTKTEDGVKKIGTILFAFPMTTETAEALMIKTKYTGLLIGMKVSDDEALQKIKDGSYTGFSIGGVRIKDEVVE